MDQPQKDPPSYSSVLGTSTGLPQDRPRPHGRDPAEAYRGIVVRGQSPAMHERGWQYVFSVNACAPHDNRRFQKFRRVRGRQ